MPQASHIDEKQLVSLISEFPNAQSEGIHESPIFLDGSSLRSETGWLLRSRPHGEAWGEIEHRVEEAGEIRREIGASSAQPQGGEQQFSLLTL